MEIKCSYECVLVVAKPEYVLIIPKLSGPLACSRDQVHVRCNSEIELKARKHSQHLQANLPAFWTPPGGDPILKLHNLVVGDFAEILQEPGLHAFFPDNHF